MRGRTILSLVVLLILLVGGTLPGAPVAATAAPGRPVSPVVESANSWVIERADIAKEAVGGDDHSLAVDGAGHLHLAYGGDHLYYAWHDGTSWHYEIVDDSRSVGNDASLALDSAGRPHIAYAARGGLKYAYSDGAQWYIETIESGSDPSSGAVPSLVLDSLDRPHIAYCRVENLSCHELVHAWYNGASWQMETIDNYEVGYANPSLAIDASDRLHVAYVAHGYLNYALMDGTSWTITPVDVSWSYAHSLALDQSGQPHIGYYDTENGNVAYASYDGSSWQIQVIQYALDNGVATIALNIDSLDRPSLAYWVPGENPYLAYAYMEGGSWAFSTVDQGTAWMSPGFVSLAADDAGSPLLAYSLWSRGLACARYDGSSWQIETVDNTDSAGWYTSLALDDLGQPHISYASTWGPRYAYRDDVGWHSERVGSWWWSADTSLALDGSGRPHIAYSTNHMLHYGYLSGTVWITETLDSGLGNRDRYLSLALDADGRPHIAYTVGPFYYGGALKYAHWDGSSWQFETVDSLISRPGPARLALDAAGHPHIAYCVLFTSYSDYSVCDDLKYASYDGASWTVQTVDSVGLVGGYPSLVLDPAGRPHISYCKNQLVSSEAVCDELRYAYSDGNAWHLEVVAGPELWGKYTSLALDAAGWPHLSYCASPGEYSTRCTALWYAYQDPSGWHRQAVASGDYLGGFSSLQLDAQGRPHISYADELAGDLMYAYQDCNALGQVGLAGPSTLAVGETGLYTASYAPLTATQPVTLTWSNGTVGFTAAYSWSLPGRYTVTVVAANECSTLQAALAVLVESSCQPVEGLEISGPVQVGVGQEQTYTATVRPPTATLPLTITWDNGTVGASAIYRWDQPGPWTLTVTATNACGEVPAALGVEVRQYAVYLPLVLVQR